MCAAIVTCVLLDEFIVPMDDGDEVHADVLSFLNWAIG